jgi:hypothetical protein
VGSWAIGFHIITLPGSGRGVAFPALGCDMYRRLVAGDPERCDPASVWVGAPVAAEPGPHLAEAEVRSQAAQRPWLDQQTLRHPYMNFLNSENMSFHCNCYFKGS